MDTDGAVTFETVTRRFNGTVAVSDMSLHVEAGTIVGIIGPSGAGKTTAVRLMTGGLEPSSGRVRVLGEDPRSFRRRTRERIGSMPQQFTLYPDLTAGENVDFVASLFGLLWLRRRRRVRDVLRLVDLWDVRGRRAGALSGGMQRRLELASGFVLNVDEFEPAVRGVAYVLPVTHGIRLAQDVMLHGWITAVARRRPGRHRRRVAVHLVGAPSTRHDPALMPVGPARGWSLALVAFGVSGLVIVAIGLAAVLAWDAGSDPAAADPIADLRATLAGSRAAVIDAATSARSADAGLVAAAEAAGSAGALTRDLSNAARGLASALRTSVFGVEPLAPAAPAFGRRLADLDRAIDDTVTRVGQSITTLRLLVAAVLAWLAVAAAGSVLLGLRLRSGSAP